MTVHADALPEPIRALGRNLVWKLEKVPDRDKPTKVPYVAGDPSRKASSTGPETWGPFEVALGNVEDGKADGVGFVLGDGPGGHFAGVDLDDCVDPDTGELEEWAAEIVHELDSYTEFSPSRTGLHIIMRGTLPPNGRRRGNVEMYDSGRFFTVTGQHLEGTPTTIENRTDALARVHAQLFADREKRQDAARAMPTVPVDLNDQEILNRALAAKNGDAFKRLLSGDTTGYDSRSEADLAFCNMLAFWFGRDAGRMDRVFRGSGLMRPKWDSRREDSTYGADTIKLAVADCKEVYSPNGNGSTPLRLGGVELRHQNGNGASKGISNGNGDGSSTEPISIEDFYAYMPQHEYLFVPSREMWPAASVNARFQLVDAMNNPIKASAYLDRNRSIEQMTWAPGRPEVIEDRLVSHGGWIDRAGCKCFNLYRPPTIALGDSHQAQPWIDHVWTVFPDEAAHIIAWLAHRVQRPYEKVNHGLLLGGLQGTGKDTLLEPVKHAVGPWNFSEVSPTQLLGRFNGFVKSVILRVSEARDLGGDGQELGGRNRYSFYEHLKTYAAAPPDVLRVDEKHLREYAAFNVTGVIITSNHRDGVYLPADDRRFFVAWSELNKDDFELDYWTRLYAWYERGGHEHVAAYLAEYDLTSFSPKAPPPKTAAFWDIVDANRAPEDDELTDALEQLGDPDATTIADIAANSEPSFRDWLTDRRNSRQVPHRMQGAGYVPVRNDGQKDGRWKIGGKNRVIYARSTLSPRDRLEVARDFAEGSRWNL